MYGANPGILLIIKDSKLIGFVMQKKFFIFSLIIITNTTTVTPTTKTNKLVDALAQNTQPAVAPQLPQASAKRVVNITNNIKPEMLIYNHWTGKKEPNPFAIIVDGKPLESGKTATVSIENDILPVQFSYSFAMGLHKGKNEVTFEIPEKQDKLSMTFSWGNHFRVILDNAKPLKKKPIKDQAS